VARPHLYIQVHDALDEMHNVTVHTDICMFTNPFLRERRYNNSWVDDLEVVAQHFKLWVSPPCGHRQLSVVRHHRICHSAKSGSNQRVTDSDIHIFEGRGGGYKYNWCKAVLRRDASLDLSLYKSGSNQRVTGSDIHIFEGRGGISITDVRQLSVVRHHWICHSTRVVQTFEARGININRGV